MDIVFLLNIVGVISALIATFVGVTENKTWKDGHPTKTGCLAICLALIASATQIGVQVIQFNEKEALISDMRAMKTGWISIGSYNNLKKKWECISQVCPYIFNKNIENITPDQIRIGTNTLISPKSLQGRYDKPNICPDTKDQSGESWLERTHNVVTVFERMDSVSIIEKATYNDCPEPGKTKVFLKVVINPKS
jgi:hypothetical protein